MEKSIGLTPSEQYLANLCEKSFLSLWSYPNLYNDKGRHDGKGTGQELCDLLVVFGNDVIIFSDKSCAFSEGEVTLAWKRWFKKAVLKSADQIFGAERWIRNFSERIYLDAHCTHKLPLRLPEADSIRIHRIVVALNVSEPVKKYFQSSSGSLLIRPDLKGKDHLAQDNLPFTIGQLNPEAGYVHIFDDTSLDIVLKELDTISDFVDYLTKKESFILSGQLLSATGEEDLLAFYLRNMDDKAAREFVSEASTSQAKPTKVIINEGLWDIFSKHPQYLARNKENKISYFWDQLIEHFNEHYRNQSLTIEADSPEIDYEFAIRRLASESRLYRRHLAHSFIDFIKKTPPNANGTRVILAPNDPDTAYVLLLLPSEGQKDYQEYKEVRAYWLSTYCGGVAARFRNLKTIIGIATEPMQSSISSFDLIYYNLNNWTDNNYQEALQEATEWNILKPENLEWIKDTTIEYPEVVTQTKAPVPGWGKPKSKKNKKRKAEKKARQATRRK